MPDFDRAIVEEIKAIDGKRCADALKQGDMVLALVPIGQRGQDNGAGDALERLAQETGIDAGVLRNRRLVSSRVPNTLRSAFVTWSAYYEASQEPEEEQRRRLLQKLQDTRPNTRSGRWTVDAVRAEMGREARQHDPMARALRQATPEAAAQAVATALADPAVAEAFADAAIALGSGPARALEGLNDRVVGQRLDDALGMPTVSVETVQARIKEAHDESAPYQYDRLKQTLSAFFARYAAGDVADAIAASPHTDRLDLYLDGAEQVLGWFQEFKRALTAASRPRLVGQVETAS